MAGTCRLIFDPFAQADGSTRGATGGTGLGLSISSRIVALMGGQIGVDSEVGKGSTFRFNARFGKAAIGANAPNTSPPARLRGLSVLVVDDNATNRRVLSGLLRLWGARPTTADGGAAALAELRRAVATGAKYPLLLIDAMMPDMDGFMLIEQLRNEPAIAPCTIMMLTSADRQSDAARCRRLGLSGYLVKPVKADELQIAILAALRGTSLGKRPSRPAAVVSASPAAATAPSRGLRILLAEDDLVSRTMLSRLLASWGHDVAVTVDGRAAWDILERDDSPKVAILDWMMPELDGAEVCRRVRGLSRQEPTYLILLTAKDRTEDVVEGLDSGANDYLVKPFDRRELQARLRVAERVVALQHELADRVRELREALGRIHQLQDLLPICSYCKKIRDDGNYWQQVEGYLSSHAGVRFSHGVCPGCYAKCVAEVEPV